MAREIKGEKTQALADYEKSLACSKPKLTSFKRQFARTRIRELARSA